MSISRASKILRNLLTTCYKYRNAQLLRKSTLFFNNFRVLLDPTRGTLVLEEIDINSIEGIYGGLNQTAWRTKFRQAHGQLERVRGRLARLPAENVAQVADLEKQESYWDEQLRRLNLKATRAGVPRSWRD